ncbi:MAG: HAD family hydrolase [Anaerolineales bacterium]|nr:HAD family hydrolase [Anaerolineales bacterium]
MAIKALVFDFDGLILDTEAPIFRAWQEIYAAHGCVLSFDDWAKIIGTADFNFMPLDELERQVGQSLDRQAITSWERKRELELIEAQPVLPGVREYLQDARRLGLRVGLASSSTCAWVSGHLQRLGLLEYFSVIQASDDVPRTKPDPALYLQAVQALGASPPEAIAFEDSPNGILAARRAGLFCVAVPNALTRSLDTSQADLALGSLAEMGLEELVRVVEGREGGQPG